MDDQAPLTVTYSESEEETEEEEIQSEEEMPSIRGSAEILDSSQPESVRNYTYQFINHTHWYYVHVHSFSLFFHLSFSLL